MTLEVSNDDVVRHPESIYIEAIEAENNDSKLHTVGSSNYMSEVANNSKNNVTITTPILSKNLNKSNPNLGNNQPSNDISQGVSHQGLHPIYQLSNGGSLHDSGSNPNLIPGHANLPSSQNSSSANPNASGNNTSNSDVLGSVANSNTVNMSEFELARRLGVRFDSSNAAWVARWVDPQNDRKKSRWFSIAKYGNLAARRHAILVSLQNMKYSDFLGLGDLKDIIKSFNVTPGIIGSGNNPGVQGQNHHAYSHLSGVDVSRTPGIIPGVVRGTSIDSNALQVMGLFDGTNKLSNSPYPQPHPFFHHFSHPHNPFAIPNIHPQTMAGYMAAASMPPGMANIPGHPAAFTGFVNPQIQQQYPGFIGHVHPHHQLSPLVNSQKVGHESSDSQSFQYPSSQASDGVSNSGTMDMPKIEDNVSNMIGISQWMPHGMIPTAQGINFASLSQTVNMNAFNPNMGVNLFQGNLNLGCIPPNMNINNMQPQDNQGQMCIDGSLQGSNQNFFQMNYSGNQNTDGSMNQRLVMSCSKQESEIPISGKSEKQYINMINGIKHTPDMGDRSDTPVDCNVGSMNMGMDTSLNQSVIMERRSDDLLLNSSNIDCITPLHEKEKSGNTDHLICSENRLNSNSAPTDTSFMKHIPNSNMQQSPSQLDPNRSQFMIPNSYNTQDTLLEENRSEDPNSNDQEEDGENGEDEKSRDDAIKNENNSNDPSASKMKKRRRVDEISNEASEPSESIIPENISNDQANMNNNVNSLITNGLPFNFLNNPAMVNANNPPGSMGGGPPAPIPSAYYSLFSPFPGAANQHPLLFQPVGAHNSSNQNPEGHAGMQPNPFMPQSFSFPLIHPHTAAAGFIAHPHLQTYLHLDMPGGSSFAPNQLFKAAAMGSNPHGNILLGQGIPPNYQHPQNSMSLNNRVMLGDSAHTTVPRDSTSSIASTGAEATNSSIYNTSNQVMGQSSGETPIPYPKRMSGSHHVSTGSSSLSTSGGTGSAGTLSGKNPKMTCERGLHYSKFYAGSQECWIAVWNTKGGLIMHEAFDVSVYGYECAKNKAREARDNAYSNNVTITEYSRPSWKSHSNTGIPHVSLDSQQLRFRAHKFGRRLCRSFSFGKRRGSYASQACAFDAAVLWVIQQPENSEVRPVVSSNCACAIP